MAKGQKRSSREPKKPKQNKLKPGAAKAAVSGIRAKQVAATPDQKK